MTSLATAEQLPIETQIVQEITLDQLEQAVTRRDKRVFLWTQTELDLLREYIPSTHYRIMRDLYGYWPQERLSSRNQRIALQVQSELANRSSTMDVGIVHGRFDAGTVRNKYYHLRRMYTLFGLLGIPVQNKLSPDTLTDLHEGNLADRFIRIKLHYASLLHLLPEYSNTVDTETKTANYLTRAQRDKFCYVDLLCQTIGSDLEAIVVYGSAVREENSYKDYDNYLLVKPGSLERVYAAIRGKAFTHQNDGKEISVNVVPTSSFSFFSRINHDPHEKREHGLVIHGEASFAAPSDDEIKERGVSYAVLRGKILKTAAGWVAHHPGILADKPHLFDYFQKTPLFIMQAALNSSQGVRSRTKEELEAQLMLFNGRVMPFNPHPHYITRVTCHASVVATNILERYYRGKTFDAQFLAVPAPRRVLNAQH